MSYLYGGFVLFILLAIGMGIWWRSYHHPLLRQGKSVAQVRSAYQAATHIKLALGPRIMVVGGGTGLSSVLSGLKHYSSNLTAVVTVTDEGGSSGRIIRDWGLLPPGDIRNCLVALSANDDRLRAFLDFRFDRGDLKGHSLGNLMLLAAAEQTGDFKEAVLLMNSLLAVRGTVLPVTVEPVTLIADLVDGRRVRGELAVTDEGEKIQALGLEPVDAKCVVEALDALERVDLVCLGPGSLFTSVLPNLLVDDFRDKLLSCSVPIVYVANLMTQHNETTHLDLMGHLAWVEKVLGRLPDYVIVNDSLPPPSIVERYERLGAKMLMLNKVEEQLLFERGCRVIRAELMQVDEQNRLRHRSGHLAEILVRLSRSEDTVS